MAEIEHVEYTFYLDIFFYDLSLVLLFFGFLVMVFYFFKLKETIEEETHPFLHSLILYSCFLISAQVMTHIFKRATNYNTKTDVPNYENLYLLSVIGLLLVVFGGRGRR